MEFDEEKYLRLHKASGFKKGDRVLIVRKANSFQDGWDNKWVSQMDVYVGKVFEIKKDCDNRGFLLSIWGFPYFVLVKVKDEEVIGSIKIER